MKITLNKKLAAAIAGVSVVLSATGVAANRASIYEQNCLSYEKQMSASVDKSTSIMKQFESYGKALNQNPWNILAIAPFLPDLYKERETIDKQANDLEYAYLRTCGPERMAKFFNSADMKAKLTSDWVWRQAVAKINK